MLRLRLVFLSALCSAACAQIAGFDRLSSRSTEDADGGAGSASAGTKATGGTGNAVAGRGPITGAAGKTAGGSVGGTTASGGTVDDGNGGNVSTSGGMGTTGGTTSGPANGGAGGNGGSAVVVGSAGSAPTAGAAGAPVVGGCNAELLKNGDFEAGVANWRQDSTAPGILEVADIIKKAGSPGLVTANVAPYAGSYLAWLGGVQDSDKGSHMNLLQDVAIPQKVSRLVLSGWIQIRSTETNSADTTDQIDLTLQDDQKYWSFHFWKGTEVTTGWKSFSYEFSDAQRLDALRGRTLTFYAESIADRTDITSYWLDSLSLFAECPH